MGTIPELGLSDLARIDNIFDDPADLFKSWHDEVKQYEPQRLNICCLATTSKDLKVSARNVVLREFDKDGFVIVTDKRSRKVDDLENVPNAAMCFLWSYCNNQQHHVIKQVRVEGTMQLLKADEYKHLYDREPLYCKIRAHVCHQDQPVDWNDLKRRHDELLENVNRNKVNLPMPDHFVGYKLLPTKYDFYFARDHFIADRILYERDGLTEPWNNHRICA